MTWAHWVAALIVIEFIYYWDRLITLSPLFLVSARLCSLHLLLSSS